ncbi:MAG: DUF3568 family protein [Candidatus Methylomirabilia bacterium]
MGDVKPRGMAVALAIVTLFASQGCAAVGLTVFGVGAGVSARTGVSHTFGSVAYKTFTAPLEALHTATLMTLKRMDITVTGGDDTEAGRTILAKAADRKVEIKLGTLTSRTTRMRVVAKKSWLNWDRATAIEIIVQTGQTLVDNPHLAATGSEARAPRP